MKIKNQFILSMSIFSAVLLFVAMPVIVTNQQIAEIDAQQDFSESIERGAGKLSILSGQYFLYQQDQQLTLWQSNVASILENLSQLNPVNSQQQKLVNNVRGDLEQLNAEFTGVVSFLETAPRNTSVRVISEFQNSWDRLINGHQTFALDAFRLSESLRTQDDQLRQTSTVLIIALFGIFGGFFFTNYLLAYGLQKRLRHRAENLEKLVEERTKRLKDAERLAAIGQTAGMVGHDIRNPLQAITSDVYLAKTDLALTPESEAKASVRESLVEIENNVYYINKIVADLQDYARHIQPTATATDLEEVIKDLLLLKSNVPENVKVSIHVENDSKNIMVDADLLKRILGNLVTNAVQAMPKGGNLSVYAYRESDDCVITVKDTGVGIPEEAKGRIFTPLFTTKSKGQGLGLAVVERLTAALGGTVTFESQEGKGTTFMVRLPTPRYNL